jgi:hypothetical protein
MGLIAGTVTIKPGFLRTLNILLSQQGRIKRMQLKETSKLPDEYIEKMAKFYTSEFVAKNLPELRKQTFIEWLTVKARERGWILT